MSRQRPQPPRSPAQPRTGAFAALQRHGRELALSILPVVGIATVTRVAFAEAYRIPSGSMEPTLLVGDWLFANKLRYGPHIPFTSVNLPGYATPRRGDVAIFVSPPQDPSIRITPDDVTPTLVKRIVGVAGDTLAMRHGQLYVNGIAETPGSGATAPVTTGAASYLRDPQPIFAWQRGFETSASRLGPPPAHPSLHEWGPLVVPAGTYFMLGDNRDNSVDSRYYGPVPRENLRGTPMFVYYTYDPEAGGEYVRALTAIRWRRLGEWID